MALNIEGTLRIDATQLTMAEQAKIWDFLEERGLVIDNPQAATPRQGIYYTAVLAWVYLQRENPELTFEEVFNSLRPAQVELIETNPTNGATGAVRSRPWPRSAGSGGLRQRNTGRSGSKK